MTFAWKMTTSLLHLSPFRSVTVFILLINTSLFECLISLVKYSDCGLWRELYFLLSFGLFEHYWDFAIHLDKLHLRRWICAQWRFSICILSLDLRGVISCIEIDYTWQFAFIRRAQMVKKRPPRHISVRLLVHLLLRFTIHVGCFSKIWHFGQKWTSPSSHTCTCNRQVVYRRNVVEVES